MMTAKHSTTYLAPTSLKHHLLIATPTLGNDYFSNTVIYICEHNLDGTMGLIINKPFGNLSLTNVFDQMNLQASDNANDRDIMQGGPVKKERGFILHRGNGNWESSMQVQDDIYLTTSQDIISALAKNSGPSQYIFTLGFSGWDPSQLEQEIAGNNWLVIPADPKILFNASHQDIRLQAAQTLNINLDLLGQSHGCA